MIFHCLRHWVHNYHVDGFRFDLASILSRDRDGDLVPNPPVVESIAEDPLLADTKIIAEAWDAAGAYQVGTFGSIALGRMERPLSRRRAAASGAAIRDMIGPLATRLAGSSDLYQAERPAAVSQHQLHHLARRLHAQRPGQLQRQAQRGQRRGQPRRRQQQLTATTTASKGRRAARRRIGPPAADQEHAGHAAAEPGRADDAGRATSAAARSAATTTPTARTTTSPGSIGR